MCGYLTNLDEIVIGRTTEAGGGRWVGYVLRCVNSVDPHGMRSLKEPGKPPCSFAVPMTLEPNAHARGPVSTTS